MSMLHSFVTQSSTRLSKLHCISCNQYVGIGSCTCTVSSALSSDVPGVQTHEATNLASS